jgi:hypothetical protein
VYTSQRLQYVRVVHSRPPNLIIGLECTNRGVLDVTSNILSQSDEYLHSEVYTTLRDSFADVRAVSLRLSIADAVLIASLPKSAFGSGKSQVEQIIVATNHAGVPSAITYRLKPALGAPLFTTSLVSTVPAVTLSGPYITKADLRVHQPDEAKAEDEEEEQSFIRKYWWVFLGFLLLSSVMNSSQAESSDK